MENAGLVSTTDYVPPRVITQKLHVSPGALRIWGDKGKIRMFKTPSGHRYYHLQDIKDVLGLSVPATPLQKQKCCYARVSTSKQVDDLRRQEDMFRSQFPDHDLVSDVASGINWKRKGLQTLLERSMSGHLKELVIAHRDRLCRFAFDLLRFIFEKNQTRLIILDDTGYGFSEQELTDDILSIIHVYSCRAMGKRRYPNKKNTSLPDPSSETDTDTVDGDVSLRVQQDVGLHQTEDERRQD